ncbi:alkaline phosphatase family protein [Pseudodesulfovibrio senegalensis]|uniref:Phosphodiesterase n=1 Tax=Pseudodesulfovibrio senegalensis TaxID=1721087 RepID=A0A6N6N2D8_9BACT|nr:alkaline phosphatase family protein [Pseudodesulfovibrio senegalensis]KAB1441166.1 phosphodiesterase [Pseudodesulfovibrio senegalensis]
MSLLLSHTARTRARCVVIGLDGLPLELAKSWGDSLPSIARIARQAATIRAELPELSPVNWTSLFTAAGPEEHGVFGFARFDPNTYQSGIANFSQVAVPTIFDQLGERGLVSRVINLPNTYPARPIRGMLVSGFVAESLDQAVYPPFLAQELADKGYRLEADTTRGISDPEHLLNELEATLQSRLDAVEMMWPDLAWDLFVLVFTETDRLFHFLMHAVRDHDHPLHDRCMRFLRLWDKAVGLVLDRYDALPDPKRLIVLADHGFTELKTEVDINALLRQHGWLHQTRIPDNEWDSSCIAGESRAFALDPGRIYLHTRDRFSRSALSREQTVSLVPQICNALENLTYNGEKVIERVFGAAELYPGPFLDRAPDLLCLARPGFDLKAKFNRDEVFGTYGRSGTHTAYGAIFYDSQGHTPKRMRDAGKLILDHFGITS